MDGYDLIALDMDGTLLTSDKRVLAETARDIDAAAAAGKTLAFCTGRCVPEMVQYAEPFRVSHDAAEPVAYRFFCGGKSVAVATDLGCYDDYIVENLKDLDAVLIESNHDRNMLQVGTYPYYLKQRILSSRGHLSNEHAGRLLGEILSDRMQAVMLGHLSKENNYEALALATVSAEITMGDNPYKAGDFRIEIAKRDVPTQPVTV